MKNTEYHFGIKLEFQSDVQRCSKIVIRKKKKQAHSKTLFFLCWSVHFPQNVHYLLDEASSVFYISSDWMYKYWLLYHSLTMSITVSPWI